MAVCFMPQTWNSICGKVRLSLGKWVGEGKTCPCAGYAVTSPGFVDHSPEFS